MLIDTHTHLYLEEFQPNPQDVVTRAIEVGVEQMIFPNVDLSTIAPMQNLHNLFPKNTFMAMGLHPTEIKDSWVEDLAKVKTEFNQNQNEYIAVGEIGIDLYCCLTLSLYSPANMVRESPQRVSSCGHS